jgi:hypothetical protein
VELDSEGGLVYDGLWRHSSKDENGIFYWEDGRTKAYEGDHRLKVKSGQGRLFDAEGNL